MEESTTDQPSQLTSSPVDLWLLAIFGGNLGLLLAWIFSSRDGHFRIALKWCAISSTLLATAFFYGSKPRIFQALAPFQVVRSWNSHFLEISGTPMTPVGGGTGQIPNRDEGSLSVYGMGKFDFHSREFMSKVPYILLNLQRVIPCPNLPPDAGPTQVPPEVQAQLDWMEALLTSQAEASTIIPDFTDTTPVYPRHPARRSSLPAANKTRFQVPVEAAFNCSSSEKLSLGVVVRIAETEKAKELEKGDWIRLEEKKGLTKIAGAEKAGAIKPPSRKFESRPSYVP
ncbi:hypothetical protein L198_07726 [Cryptococcus wingfieldii CBS 7118]|uniref:Uncharacterized protein n=1 Tax=Cryptococcus wingfieldii CBS 7118 TaxID=1295528 RepID=A0A1E3I1K7_9TREE|nr:hypothetical protein L198_07726 [Cryptococcus wingfieldii CBS 7118]ODN82504.1 hypothetical protein L198_07726 [Cryptococcus wingfieldii CBS 7118]